MENCIIVLTSSSLESCIDPTLPTFIPYNGAVMHERSHLYSRRTAYQMWLSQAYSLATDRVPEKGGQPGSFFHFGRSTGQRATIKIHLLRLTYDIYRCAEFDLQNMSLIGQGATGTVYQLNAFIAVKRARLGEDEEADHANEQRNFKFLENYPPIPYLIRCYHRTPKDTFLELAPNGSIAMLLNQYQERDSHGTVLKITQALDSQDLHRWMKQLCLAAAGLERIGLFHGDIRPGNMLLDANRDLKLSDLDRGMKIGEDIAVLTEPFGRLLDKEDGEGADTYGKAGARTETFAIGSVYYTLLRGHEPYETESWGRNHFVILGEKFRKREFPLLTNSAEDTIVRKCWNGEYQLVSKLLAEVAGYNRQDEPAGENQEWLRMRKMECKTFVQNGRVDMLGRY